MPAEEPRKMWFPDGKQWFLLWIGLFMWGAAWSAENYTFAIFIAVGILFLVWMLEGRRRKS